MVTLEYRKIDRFDTIINDARQACTSRPVHNLLLAYEFSTELIHSQFVKLYEEKAREWQADPPPSNLIFSHGQYFHGEEGIRYVIRELQAKSNSRRALLSLTNMSNFIGSGDQAVPSFMIAQFAIESDVLYITEYFRAIEVGSFLPINVTEAALLAKRILEAVRPPRIIRLLIMAFNAHLTSSFHCLEKAGIDMLKGGEIGVAVARKNSALLIEWLEGKRLFESEVAIHGLEELLAAVKSCADSYSQAFMSNLQQAFNMLSEIKQMRRSSSLESSIESRREEYLKLVDSAIAELRREQRGA